MDIKSSKSVIQKAIDKAKKQHEELRHDGVWVCVGSAVTGNLSPESDIDLLLFTKDDYDFKRLKTEDNITVCRVPHSLLKEDSFSGKYGGYFSAKLFNPHIIMTNDDPGISESVISAPALFFGPFISFRLNQQARKELLSYEKLSALALVTFFDYNPLYLGWWIQNHVSENKNEIWDYTVNQFKSSLSAAGYYFEDSEPNLRNDKYEAKLLDIKSRDQYQFEAFARGVSHWSFGIKTHDDSFDFINWAISKSRTNILKNNGFDSLQLHELSKELAERSGAVPYWMEHEK